MAELDLQIITSVSELRSQASQWDDLWQRSELTYPAAKAEPLAIWLEEFAPDAKFRAVVLRDGDRMLASLPLVQQRMGRIVRVAALPSNGYAASGDLAIDRECDQQRIAAQLAQALKKLPWRLFALHGVQIDAERWRALHQALQAGGMLAEFQHLWDTGITDIPHDWKLFMASRSGKVRSAMKRSFEKLCEAGGSELTILSQIEPSQIESHLRRGFAVEDRSWKSNSGTSVLRSPGVFQFYCRQAAALASTGNLELVFLEHAGQPIGFLYGIHAKGVFYPPKIGYDDRFAAYSPGQLLNCQMLERFQQNADRNFIDFHGPLSPSFGRWATRSYRNGQLLVATGGPVSRAVCRVQVKLRPALRSLRDRFRRQSHPAVEIYPLRSKSQTGNKAKNAAELVEVTSA